jgi:CDP-diacylglycerol--glycerol-3-phosphate 3-phosphatidyltransferase
MFLIPVFLAAINGDWPRWLDAPAFWYSVRPWIAAFVFAALAATDGVDGYLARSRNEITTFGKFLDPLADKLLVTAALLALVEMRVVPTWIALVIIAREFIVSGLRMVARRRASDRAHGTARLRPCSDCAILLFIVKDSSFFHDLSPRADVDAIVARSVMGAAVVMTIMSMVDYFMHARVCSSARGRIVIACGRRCASRREVRQPETDETVD